MASGTFFSLLDDENFCAQTTKYLSVSTNQKSVTALSNINLFELMSLGSKRPRLN